MKTHPLQTCIKYLALGRYRGHATKISHIPTDSYASNPTRLSLLKGQRVFGYGMPAHAWLRGHLPVRVTAGHQASRVRRNNHAERVRFYQRDSWRYSRNYGYWVLRQRRNAHRGLHYWRRQNYAKYEISMTYGNIQANNVIRVESPRRKRYARESRIRLATVVLYEVAEERINFLYFIQV